MGSNPLSRIEVVSSLNILSQANRMYMYYDQEMGSKYSPKVYLGTLQSIAYWWNYDYQNIENYPSTWPEVKPQKGEANKKWAIRPFN